jgi:hypothetical protein
MQATRTCPRHLEAASFRIVQTRGSNNLFKVALNWTNARGGLRIAMQRAIRYSRGRPRAGDTCAPLGIP